MVRDLGRCMLRQFQLFGFYRYIVYILYIYRIYIVYILYIYTYVFVYILRIYIYILYIVYTIYIIYRCLMLRRMRSAAGVLDTTI